MNKTLLTLDKVSLQFQPDKYVLKDISFQLKQGELVSLIGLNGSGKTSLLQILVGLIKPSAGVVNKFTNKIGFVPQYHDLNLSFPITVAELGNLFGGVDYQKHLARVGMAKYQQSLLKNLSGGQMQRILIAVSLSQNPDIILFDEPTSGIDLIGQQSFYELIDDIRTTQKTTILVVSHDIHLVMRHSTQVICLSNSLCCIGTPQEITHSPEFNEAFGQYLIPYIHKHV